MGRRESTCNAAAPRLRGAASHVLRAVLCVFLSFLIALVPVGVYLETPHDLSPCKLDKFGVNVGKSEAHAFAPVLVGAGALAAELGISSEALLMGITVLVAGASGYMMAQDGWTHMSDSSVSGALGRLLDPNADLGDMTDDDNYGDVWDSWSPDGRSWDDLSTTEKAKYGTPANWVANRWEDVFLATELTEAGNGGNQPTSDGGGPWQQVRNALILLGTGAASVGLSEAAGALGALCGDGIHEFLFGNDEYVNKANTPMLWLPYQQNVLVGGVEFPFSIYGINYDRLSWTHFTPTNWGFYQPTISGISSTNIFTNGTNRSSYNLVNYEIIVNGTSSYISAPSNAVSAYVTTSGNWDSTYNLSGTAGGLGFLSGLQLNQNYEGSYVFKVSGSQVASLSNGSWTGDYQIASTDYGQLPQTPPEIDTNIYNQPELETGYETVEQDVDEANKKNAIALPTYLGQPEFTADPDYWTFVTPVPEAQISPLPDDSQVDPDNPPLPDLPDDPTPGDEWDFSTELTSAIDNLADSSVGNVFPFCLINDLRNLTAKFNQVPSRTRANYAVITIPLSDFDVDGMNSLTLDLTPILQFGNMVRPWWNILFLAMLVGESVRYFLK